MRLYRRILRIFPGFSAEYLENSFQNNLLTVVLIYSVTYTLVFELCASYLHLNKKRFEKLWLNFLILGYKTQFFALSYFLPKKMQNSPILCGLSSSEQTNYPELFPIRQSDILINRTRRFKIFSIVDLTVCVTKYLFTSLAFGKLLSCYSLWTDRSPRYVPDIEKCVLWSPFICLSLLWRYLDFFPHLNNMLTTCVKLLHLTK